ncbi:MAG TPA: polysaccharide pyruvyl transferase family protein [Gallicola sp.]|nr:polysaccharide pyruvyl transferase family protein [Gallicola sp.]
MKIQIDGVGTQNKGAELMLYSILEQIEKQHPRATVYFNSNTIGHNKIDTTINLIKPFRLQYTFYLRVLLSKLKLPHKYFTTLYPIKNIDLLLDASGFKYGDQWNHSDYFYQSLEQYYKTLKDQKTKIILLPQAFGPFDKNNSRKAIGILNDYVDIIISRDSISTSYLKNSGVNMNKVYQYPDFTSLTNGEFPERYNEIKGGICIIPNSKMLTHTEYSKKQYFEFYDNIIKEVSKKHKVFLLNHEGKGDLKLCEEINSKYNFDIPIVTNLNAKEIKGVIKESKLVISSRFHGVASSLNQSVPCFSTSWSHKYELLLSYFGFEDFVLNIDSNPLDVKNKINSLLTNENQKEVRDKLSEKVKEMNNNIEEMWEKIWDFK